MVALRAGSVIILVSLFALIVFNWVDWFSSRNTVIETTAITYAEQTEYELGAVAENSYNSRQSEWPDPLQSTADTSISSVNDAANAARDNKTAELNENSANTTVGHGINVSLPGISVNFNTITAEGTTSLVRSSNNPMGDANIDSYDANNYFDITTTATYRGPILVGAGYNEYIVENEKDLKLFHWDGARWDDVTTFVDSEKNMVYGEVNSLSWFFIGGQWVWREDSLPVFAAVVGKTLFLTDTITDVWYAGKVVPSDDECTENEVEFEATECGKQTWSIFEYIVLDSVISWKYWLPSVVNFTKALSSTYEASD
jgi:hypothetical protein